MITTFACDFNSWRENARKLLQSNVHPSQVIWNGLTAQTSLFNEQIFINTDSKNYNVPAEFLKLAETVCYHRNQEKFNLLYHMLWRLVHENKHLLQVASDPLTNALGLMIKGVKRDVHKTKAFVRFRKTYDEDGEEHFVAWHKPDHYTLKLSAPFFQRRFAIMRWTILTPDESVYWDGETLHFGLGAKASDAPSDDEMEVLWKEFYRAIFNPARIKIKAMKKEMPVRHWATMPETAIIKEMLAEAPARVQKMIEHQEGHAYSAEDFIPRSDNLEVLREASKSCQGCPLYKPATQTVFGEGAINARLMLVGEQPGNEEDKNGHAFIGPAGKILNQALEEAKIDRNQIYLTNAVKHFKFQNKDGFRLHRSPSLQDIVNCKPWLEAELRAIKPELIVCLGITAAKSLINPRFKQETRSNIIEMNGTFFLPTYHPSAVLRAKESEAIYAILVRDLITARNYLSL